MLDRLSHAARPPAGAPNLAQACAIQSSTREQLASVHMGGKRGRSSHAHVTLCNAAVAKWVCRRVRYAQNYMHIRENTYIHTRTHFPGARKVIQTVRSNAGALVAAQRMHTPLDLHIICLARPLLLPVVALQLETGIPCSSGHQLADKTRTHVHLQQTGCAQECVCV